VVLAFLPATEPALQGVPGISPAILSASQGAYTPAQMLLDITQGARVADSAYADPDPPPLTPLPNGAGARASGPSGGRVAGWPAPRARARGAPQLLVPGLLAASIPGGGAYAGIAGANHIDAVPVADRGGRIAAFSLGSPATLPARVARLAARERLVVADLPDGSAGLRQLRALAATRTPGELLLVVQRAGVAPGHELLWAAAAGLRGPVASARPVGSVGPAAAGELSSQTTRQRGLIASIDLAPTVLRHLRLPVPVQMRGAPLEVHGAVDGPRLRALMARLRVVGSRRLPALAWLAGAWALLALLCAATRRRAALAWALRIGALGVLWAPVAVLLPAALHPSPVVEYTTIALLCLTLGALTDMLAPWPRAPLAPAIAAVLALTADALAGSQLLIRSPLGPDPALGARFYGFGNELKSGLAVLVFAAVAAALYPAARGRPAALAMALAGILLAAIEGSARIGAGVGGAMLVAAATAVAAVMLLPGALTRRRALTVLAAPALALVALALLDLATAHGAGHYTGSVLHARSPADIHDLIVRRYEAAWRELRNHAMPFATALALLAALLGLRRRHRLLAPVNGDPAWQAALAGGLTAGIVGALVEDSGPVLFVLAVATLACVLAYLAGRPVTKPRKVTRPRSRHTSAPRHWRRRRHRRGQDQKARLGTLPARMEAASSSTACWESFCPSAMRWEGVIARVVRWWYSRFSRLSSAHSAS
jgi:hypothetical protein